MKGIQNLSTTSSHFQSQRQVEWYNRTIVAQLYAYAADHLRIRTSWCPFS